MYMHLNKHRMPAKLELDRIFFNIQILRKYVFSRGKIIIIIIIAGQILVSIRFPLE